MSVSEYKGNVSEYSENLSEYSKSESEDKANVSEYEVNVSEYKENISKYSENLSEYSENFSEHSANVARYTRSNNLMFLKAFLLIFVAAAAAFAQMPPIEPGVSHELAKWRAAHYSDVRYKLNLTLEKMSPVLKGTVEIRMQYAAVACAEPDCPPRYIVLDWRKIRGSESLSTVANISLNGVGVTPLGVNAPGEITPKGVTLTESNDHLIFRDGVVMGENVIKLDFTSPILTSGSAITRYVDKEDGAEYIYSLFVPSDASTAFPVFDQPDLKARFRLEIDGPKDWSVVANVNSHFEGWIDVEPPRAEKKGKVWQFNETKPISTYVFAFAAGPFSQFNYQSGDNYKNSADTFLTTPADPTAFSMNVFVRKSQIAKFQPHKAEVFRLNREGIKFLEECFDYKFPFPKYDIVLIPEFPFGGMEHAGATFLREDRVIFPSEPTRNDYITRANVIFHEAAHQWFGDTVTMKWFDDLWLKEGFAEFMAYKTLERVMPEYNAWKVFYERNKQAAYLTDSTKGTTPIYQEIANLNSAKSAYGNIVYRKAPSFLKQAEFYLGAEKFQTAVRAFLKKHEYANAGWEDLVNEMEAASKQELKLWAKQWVTVPGLPIVRTTELRGARGGCFGYFLRQTTQSGEPGHWRMRLQPYIPFANGQIWTQGDSLDELGSGAGVCDVVNENTEAKLLFPNYKDYGYGIFLLDAKSRDYVLKNIGSEKDDFLRTMMWGSLWDSVREGELDPREYVELVVKNLSVQSASFSLSSSPGKTQAKACTLNCGETDETTIATLLSRVSTAMNYYIPDAPAGGTKGEPPASAGGRTRATTNSGKTTRPTAQGEPPANAGGSPLRERLEDLLLDRLQHAPTPGQRITYFRAFVTNASTAKSREVLKQMLERSVPPAVARAQGEPPASAGGQTRPTTNSGKTTLRTAQGKPPANAGGSPFRLTAKDRFDIVMRLATLGDPDAAKLLTALEKSETGDDAKRYAYAARAGFATAANKAKYWNDFVNNKDISESWIEAAMGPFNSIRSSDLTLPYLERALKELPNHKRERKIFFVNGWLGAFIGGQKSEQALNIVNRFLVDNPNLDKDLRLKILENVDLIERAVKIRSKFEKP